MRHYEILGHHLAFLKKCSVFLKSLQAQDNFLEIPSHPTLQNIPLQESKGSEGSRSTGPKYRGQRWEAFPAYSDGAGYSVRA